MYIIENHIPIPRATTGRRAKSRATITFEAMEVGESFVVPTVLDVKRIRNAAWRSNKKMTARKVKEGVFRVWRIA